MTTNTTSRVVLVKQFLRSHLLLILILGIAAVVWSFVFSVAATDFITGGSQPYRAVWNGSGHFDLFGYTMYFNFEGYLDHDYYYYSWGQQFVSGFSPYTDAFNRIEIDGSIYNTPYFFPPLYVYMCGLGTILPIDPFGIGFLISLFGYLTALPIYGISTYLSQNNRVGAVAAASYLFNPVVLYHTVFEWLNPAPFVFFAMLSFFLLMRGNRIAGTLAMVTSAMFKQTAFFLALPLLAYLLRKPPMDISEVDDEELIPSGDDIDLRGFAKISVIVVIFVVAISLPFLTDISNYLFYIFQRPGGLLLTDVTVFPNVSQPISFAVLLISFNVVIQTLNTSLGIALPQIPESIIQTVNLGTYYTILLIIAMVPLLAKMLLTKKDDWNLRQYWSKMLFLTLLLMLCLHLFSPRGIYKYYCVALIPFFSIQPVSKMITQEAPLLFSFLILFPSRYIYLAYLFLIMVGYLAHKQFSIVVTLSSERLRPITSKFRKPTKEDIANDTTQSSGESSISSS